MNNEWNKWNTFRVPEKKERPKKNLLIPTGNIWKKRRKFFLKTEGV